MKKQNVNSFTLNKGDVLSRNEMKEVFGGNPPIGGDGDGAGKCTVTVNCLNGATISCSGSGGACKYQADSSYSYKKGWVQCDSDSKVSCT